MIIFSYTIAFLTIDFYDICDFLIYLYRIGMSLTKRYIVKEILISRYWQCLLENCLVLKDIFVLSFQSGVPCLR